MAWPTDLTQLLKRISLPAEEVFKGLRVLGDYNKTNIDALDTVVDTHAAVVDGYFRRLARNHNVYVVNIGSGDDGNEGTLASPFLTVTYALSRCVANNDDIILVGRDLWHSGDPEGEEWPIVVDKNQVHIIGIGNPRLPKVAIYPSTVDKAAFQLTSSGQYSEIANFILSAGDSHGCIEMGKSGQVDGVYIHDCTFGHELAHDTTDGSSLQPLNGILQPADATRGGRYATRIERCIFLGGGANSYGKISGNAMDFLHPTQPFYDMQIIDCIFKGLAVGINTTNARGAEILRNKFICPDSADGEAITLLANCRGCMVDGNVAMAGGDAVMSKQPYVDIAATNKNHWGVNWTTNAVDLPKQTA